MQSGAAGSAKEQSTYAPRGDSNQSAARSLASPRSSFSTDAVPRTRRPIPASLSLTSLTLTPSSHSGSLLRRVATVSHAPSPRASCGPRQRRMRREGFLGEESTAGRSTEETPAARLQTAEHGVLRFGSPPSGARDATVVSATMRQRYGLETTGTAAPPACNQ